MKCKNNKFKTVTLKLLQFAKFAFRSYSHSWKNVLPKLKIVHISANVDLLCVCARVCSWGNVIDAFFSLPLSVLMSTHHHLCLYAVKMVSYGLRNFALLELCTDWNQYLEVPQAAVPWAKLDFRPQIWCGHSEIIRISTKEGNPWQKPFVLCFQQ